MNKEPTNPPYMARVSWTPRCIKCGSTSITNGAPHSDGDLYQVECHTCGFIERINGERD